jgi:hypothetical protein
MANLIPTRVLWSKQPSQHDRIHQELDVRYLDLRTRKLTANLEKGQLETPGLAEGPAAAVEAQPSL